LLRPQVSQHSTAVNSFRFLQVRREDSSTATGALFSHCFVVVNASRGLVSAFVVIAPFIAASSPSQLFIAYLAFPHLQQLTLSIKHDPVVADIFQYGSNILTASRCGRHTALALTLRDPSR
jgi:hypothetical protein